MMKVFRTGFWMGIQKAVRCVVTRDRAQDTYVLTGKTSLKQHSSQRLALAMLLICSSPFSFAAGKPATDYLPVNSALNPDIPTPESVLGYDVGTWHVRHDQLVRYMQVLAESSDRISLEVTGYTHEQRPLLLLTITAPQNRDKLPQWQKAHVENVTQGTRAEDGAPLVLYMGYSVHGNEPSGANASLLVAYYLAASNDARVTSLLSDNVVLLDPSFNPDGLSRFAQWANMHKGQVLSSDPEHREHNEGWPNGRTNHYWFDLNRDWLMLIHPESRARIKQFQKWRPHVLTDFHEMGTDSTYFFQPGVPSRKNPFTPEGNVRLTEALADSFIQAFDDQKNLYFSEEGFDDFYYGKGSTYPDAQGSIGILFEQASSRGHLQDSINGPVAFAQTIQNQFTMSLAVFDGALKNKAALTEYPRRFYNETQSLIKDDDIAAYVLHEPKDAWRLKRAKWVFEQHGIDFIVPENDVSADDKTFAAAHTLVVPLNQQKYRLIKSLFSTQQQFPDNTFYDVSNWNLPLAFDLGFSSLTARELKRVKRGEMHQNELPAVASDAYGYAFEWHHFTSPALLQALLSAGVDARIATTSFNAMTTQGERAFELGSIVVPAGVVQPENVGALIASASAKHQVPVYSITSGSTSVGSDLGSRSMVPARAPKVLVIGGEGTNPYQVGEIWHHLDTQIGMPVTLIEQERLGRITLADYSHIVFASGRYDLNDKQSNAISEWVKAGGTLIGQMSALSLFSKEKWLSVQVSDRNDVDRLFDESGLTYADRSALAAKKLIAGAVYIANIDVTHPLFYGFDEPYLHVFKTANTVVSSSQSPFNVPARYTRSPLVAGYSADVLAEKIAGSAAVVAQPMGRGRVIGFTDNPQFRGYWYGTSKLMSNALLLSEAIR